MIAWLVSCHAAAAAAGLRAGLAAHARWRWPRPTGRIARGADGRWWLEAAGDRSLRLAPATAFGGWWADLRFCDGSHVCRVLLCRDQLSAEAWRALIVALRRERVAERSS
jgi:hypothetical protein